MTTVVRLQSNGRYWQAIWIDKHGQRRGKGLGAKAAVTEAAARKACARLQAQIIAEGDPPTHRACTLSVLEARFVAAERAALSEATIALYQQTFGRLSACFGSGFRADRIDAAAATRFRDWLSRQTDRRGGGRTIGPDTISRHIRDCRRIWRVAARLGLVAANPWVGLRAPSASASVWQYVSRGDTRVLIDYAGAELGVLIALCRFACLRRGEASRLRICDYDHERRMLTIYPRATESGHRQEGTKQRARTVPVCPELADILVRVAAQKRDIHARFCDVSMANIHRDMARAMAKSGIEPYGKMFHSLRKSGISELLSRGIAVSDVAMWCGQSVDVLMRHYAATIPQSASMVTGLPVADSASE